ncbi:hypothetical protein N7475_009505 [Penicillium sp. IBT 31633x]|nr:hypothetical protein N7475_009505 [Penicillium sp. IBT 31633x]
MLSQRITSPAGIPATGPALPRALVCHFNLPPPLKKNLNMSSDDASPQAGQNYSTSSSDASPRTLPGHNPAIAKFNKLQIRPDTIVRPDLFTLYFGFFGKGLWRRKAARTVTERVENHYVLTARPPTQDELDALVEHGTRTLYYRRLGVPVASFLGTAWLYNQARKSPLFPRNPTPAALFSTLRVMAMDSGFRGTIGSAAFKMLFITTLGGMVSGGYAVYNDAMHMLTDPRLKNFVEDMRTQKPEDVRKRKLQAASERIRSMRSGDQDIGSQLGQNIGQAGEYVGGGGYEQEQDSASPNSYSDYESTNRTQAGSQYASNDSYKQDSNVGAVWARGRGTQPESKSGMDFMDDDDASPTAAEYRDTNIDGSPAGSAWDRIRQQNARAGSHPRQQPGIGMPPPSYNPYAEFYQSGHDQHGSSDSNERNKAQADFDRMIEAERNTGSEGSPRNRGW